jgi:HEAT repeat protein
MEAVLGVIAGAAILAEVLARLGRRQARLRIWRELAKTAGLTNVRMTNGLFRASLAGRAVGLSVRIEEYEAASRNSGTRFLVSGLGGGDLFLRREGLGTVLGEGLLGEREIVTGSPEFDSQVYVQGTAPVVFAVLDAETRRRVSLLLAGKLSVGSQIVAVRATVVDGVLTVEARKRRVDAAELNAILLAVLELAGRLTAPPGVARRLARNLLRDPEAGVRLNVLTTLAREYSKHPATRRALLAARKDASPEVRLRAALALGEDGRETLLALVANEGADDACAARAVTALGEDLPIAEAARLLRPAVDSGHVETAIGCLEVLGNRGVATQEDEMLAALHSPVDAVRTAAARALGRAGTVAAIQDLRALSQSESPVARGAARQAIAEIQSRLPGAGPGQLTLAAGEAGALSTASDQPGALSLLDAEHGRSSPLETSEPAAADETEGRPPSPPCLRNRE